MSIGILAGVLDSSRVGASLIGTASYAAGQALDIELIAPGAEEMTVFSHMAAPSLSFSATTTMIVPVVALQKTTNGVRLLASGGNIPANILVFGR